jgi:two-component system sensor histidine kinase BarA
MRTVPGIQFRLSLLGVLPAGLIGLALAAYFIEARVADLERNLDIRGDLIARELAAASASAVASGDRLALRNLADAALREEDVVEVSVYYRQGPVWAARRHSPGGDGDAEFWHRRTAPILADASPGGPQAVLGTVSLALSHDSTLKRQRETVLFSLAALLGGLAVSAWLARRMARKISEPVVALTVAVHELSKGNMEARAESEAEAELAYLQAGFNAMAAELKKNRDLLERQVRQATARLQEALDALERRNLELEAARWLAEAQTELKSRFLAQMSHEIRTPMNGIIGFAELLAKTPLSDEQAEKLGLITRSAKNLLSIINEILDLSKLEAGKISVESLPFALRPCLEDIVSLLSTRIAQPPVALWVEPGVPAAVRGDPVRLQQVVANLLGNALKFTRRGRIVVRVRVRAGRLWLSVSDSGSGISPQDQAKLFSPFLQLGKPGVGAENGAGLGLSISKNIVESMGGTIRLASRPGKGTSFWFDLPLQEADAPGSGPPPLRGRVALIEPERLFRLALAAQLRSLGAQVEAFAGLDEFIGRFDPAAEQPTALLYGVWPRREKIDPCLPRWLEWCEARQVKPVLVFPCGERRLVGFYRKRGAACLFRPLRSETLAKALGAAAPGQVLARPAPLAVPRGLRLLVADDNEINRLLLRAQLEKFQAEIVEARNGQEALERLRRLRFDLVFLDLQMPLLDGPQVLRELRGHPGPSRHAPAIAITAFSAPGEREAALRGGFADCLIKPVLEEPLARLVTAWLGVEQDPAEDGQPAAAYASAILEKAGGSRQLATVVARKLFAELPQTLRALESALVRQETDKARHCAHTLNGSASFAGLDGIRQAAADLESALRKQEDGAEALCQAVARELDRFLAAQHAIVEWLEKDLNPPNP